MSNTLLDAADHRRRGSYATKLRLKRFELFLCLLDSIRCDNIRILDVGGTVLFWENMDFIKVCRDRNIELTILNIMPQEPKYEFVKTVVGDARRLSGFPDKCFDIVFSNSVIEHVGTYSDQLAMAQEVIRTGKTYFVQTPNRYFPIEPHFLFPFFQFFPLSLKIFIMQYFGLAWYKATGSKKEAEDLVKDIRLLTLKELLRFFPHSMLYKEKLFGLTKSFIVWKVIEA